MDVESLAKNSMKEEMHEWDDLEKAEVPVLLVFAILLVNNLIIFNNYLSYILRLAAFYSLF